nr:uncharacterized protein LOC117855688 [Setaria viridis]
MSAARVAVARDREPAGAGALRARRKRQSSSCLKGNRQARSISSMIHAVWGLGYRLPPGARRHRHSSSSIGRVPLSSVLCFIKQRVKGYMDMDIIGTYDVRVVCDDAFGGDVVVLRACPFLQQIGTRGECDAHSFVRAENGGPGKVRMTELTVVVRYSGSALPRVILQTHVKCQQPFIVILQAKKMDLNIESEESFFAGFDLNLEAPLEDAMGGFDLNLEPQDDGIEDVMDLTLEPQDDDVDGGIDLNLNNIFLGRKDLSDEDRKRVYQTLLARSTDDKLKGHVTGEVAEQFGIHIHTV